MKLDAQSHIVLMGARGQMGRRFATVFRAAGNPVVEFDLPVDHSALPAAMAQADLVLLCVPITAISAVLGLVVPYLGARTILADICSVKVGPLKTMLEATTTPVVGSHPLFGPTTKDAPLRIALTAGRNQAACHALLAYFHDLGFAPFTTTAHEHDRAMAYIQGLNFVTTVAYLCAAPLGTDLGRFFTPSFERRMAAATKMITEDASLFSAMFEANPHSLEAVRQFRAYLNVAAGGDLELLSQKALWWWQGQNDAGEPSS